MQTYVKIRLTYWIPGRKLYKASIPIPKDGISISVVSLVERQYVICQTGYLANEHHFYFGENYEKVKMAEKDDDEYQLTLNGDKNMFKLPNLDSFVKTYFWRIDAQKGDYVYKGDVWTIHAI